MGSGDQGLTLLNALEDSDSSFGQRGRSFHCRKENSQGLTGCYSLQKKQRIHPGGCQAASIIWGPRQ